MRDMGRFNSLEFGKNDAAAQTTAQNAPEPKFYGEKIKDAQYFIDAADKAFYCFDYEEALKMYSKALGIDGGAVPAWSGQAFSLISLGEYHEASMWLRKTVELIGESQPILALQALVLARSGDFDRACGYADSALESAGNSPLPWIVRGEIFYYARRNAEHCFEQACGAAGNDWHTRCLIVDACFFCDRKKLAAMALKFLRPMVEVYPSKPEVWLRMGRCHTALGMSREAASALDQVSSLAPDLKILPKFYAELKNIGLWNRLLGRFR